MDTGLTGVQSAKKDEMSTLCDVSHSLSAFREIRKCKILPVCANREILFCSSIGNFVSRRLIFLFLN